MKEQLPDRKIILSFPNKYRVSWIDLIRATVYTGTKAFCSGKLYKLQIGKQDLVPPVGLLQGLVKSSILLSESASLWCRGGDWPLCFSDTKRPGWHPTWHFQVTGPAWHTVWCSDRFQEGSIASLLPHELRGNYRKPFRLSSVPHAETARFDGETERKRQEVSVLRPTSEEISAQSRGLLVSPLGFYLSRMDRKVREGKAPAADLQKPSLILMYKIDLNCWVLIKSYPQTVTDKTMLWGGQEAMGRLWAPTTLSLPLGCAMRRRKRRTGLEYY